MLNYNNLKKFWNMPTWNNLKKVFVLPKFRSLNQFTNFIMIKISIISAETFGWMAVIVLHSATIPSMLAIMSGLTDTLPNIDLVLLVWSGLALLFVKATVQRDMLNVITIGLGFMIQAVMLALIFFK